MVIKAEDDTIETDIFYIETNAERYLHFQSTHPHKIKGNIPFTLSQRITPMKIAVNSASQSYHNFLKSVTTQKIYKQRTLNELNKQFKEMKKC